MIPNFHANTTSLLITGHTTAIVKIEGYFRGTTSAAWLMVFDANIAPLNGAAPLKQVPLYPTTQFYEEFKKSRYLETYAENHQVAYAVKRVCMRVWKDPFTPEQEERMTALLTAYRSALEVDFMSIFDYISELLSTD